MGFNKLWLLLLLTSYSVAQDSIDEETQACLFATRFKANRKYVYQYTTESRNGVGGSSNVINGPKMSCQVEIEVPEICAYVMHVTGCVLSEISDLDPLGQQLPNSEAFKTAMEKNPLKFTIMSVTRVRLSPEEDESVNILNIKRGIISALIVPNLEEDSNELMGTVHGKCLTEYSVDANQDDATSVTLSRDLSQCDHFYGRELPNSHLALLQKLHSPLSKLITSKQSCNYQFDTKGKHITTATCTERHVYLPFSNEGKGISSVVVQELKLLNTKRINSQLFSVDPYYFKALPFEDPDNKAPLQTKDAVLSTLRELAALADTDQGQKRTSLFHKLVTSMRVLENETLSQTVTEMFDVSGWITWQALFQCGTSECTSAILQLIRTIDGVSLEVDALVYGLSLQKNPNEARVRDMLSMAQYKQSKAIMYALANTVNKFYKSRATPVVTDVAKFMESLLDDCSGEYRDTDSGVPVEPEDLYFLVLKVVGVMFRAMQEVSPSLTSMITRCARKPEMSLSTQKAAIQAFRLMDYDDEITSFLKEMFKDSQNPLEKRVAAYRILMRKRDIFLVQDLTSNFQNERDEQLKSFILSHLTNLRTDDEELKDYIERFLGENPVPNVISGEYKIDSPIGSLRTNILFDGKETLPKEMILGSTVKLFREYDFFEVGVEGNGFEPHVDALFGEKGFLPQSFSKILEIIYPQQNRKKRQAPQDLLREFTEAFYKLRDDLRYSPSPEAIAYLQFLGKEIGYMKTSEMRELLRTFSMYYMIFFQMLPAKGLSKLLTSTENQVFGHYIFMENAFFLPTTSGFPLKFSLAGVFAAGGKGGLAYSETPGLSSRPFAFMPSVRLEFITHMGVYIPEYVDVAVEMHTNIFHESSINAKLMFTYGKEFKLYIPAPTSNTKLFTVSNELLSISSDQTKKIPSLVGEKINTKDCQPFISGLNLCTTTQYTNASSDSAAPYFPLNGESKFAVEIEPTGKITEYTITLNQETTREGKKGRNRVETLKLTLKAEGEESTEATMALKYNRNKHILSSEIVIPDYDVEAGIKLSVTDGSTNGMKMRGINIDVTNKDIPQLSLIGRARLNEMKDAMLQLELVVPALNGDATVTANLRGDDNVLMDLETVVQFPETTYQQKASLKYDDDKFEVEVKSDFNSDIQKMIPHLEDHHRQLQQLIDDMLDQKVAKTDMKLRHIVSKGIEAGNIWLDKLSAQIPYLKNLRSKRSISDLTLPALPEKLFLQSDSLFRYQFNKERMALSIPLPFGGKKSEELNIPESLSVPVIDIPELGLSIPANNIRLPSFTVPPSLDFTMPLLGLAEASTKINSNIYSWEGTLSGGNNTADVPSYIAHYKAMAQSPLSLLSYKLEGTGMMTGSPDSNLKYLLNSSFTHSLIDTSFSVLETLRVTDKLNARANYKMEASSPLGLQASLYYSAQSTSSLDSDEVSGDGTVDGFLKMGPLYANTSYSNNYNLQVLDQEGKGESTFHFDSPIFQLDNIIHGVYANNELNIVSKTDALGDILKHVAELKYKDKQLTLKCNAMARAADARVNNKVEVGLSSDMAIIRMESQAEDSKNRAYSLMTGMLNSNGLEVNSEGSLIFDAGRGLHKASLKIDEDGLTTSGTNSLQCTPVTVENFFNGAINRNGAFLSSNTKGLSDEGKGEMNFEGKITPAEASFHGNLKGNAFDGSTSNNMNILLDRRGLTLEGNMKGTLQEMTTENSNSLELTLWTLKLRSKTNNFLCEDAHYKHDVKVDMKPFVVGLDMTNDLKLYDVRLNNEGHIKLEPVKLDLSGSVMAAYGPDHNMKHSYEITYNDMAGTVKSSTSGNVMDAQLSHGCEIEFAGLSSTSHCEARVNSEPLRFDGSIRTMALPFSLTIDAQVNSDGEIKLHGKHTGQLYSRLLAKAEPLALAFSHDSRVSTTHKFPSGEHSTNLDNKFESLLTPTNQNLLWKLKSKLNEQTYQQEMNAYNNPDLIGFEFSGGVLTDIFRRFRRSNPEMQDFSMNGFLKYDKNSDCHIVDIPYIESFPAAFEHIKNILVQALESLQQSINSLDINQVISDFRNKLDGLPMQLSDFMQRIDLDNKVSQVKEKMDYLINEFGITMDDLENIVKNWRDKLENALTHLITKIQDFLLHLEEYVKEGRLADTITSLLSNIEKQLLDIDVQFQTKSTFLKIIDVIEDVFRQIDLQKLKDSSMEFLKDFDAEYGVLETVTAKLSKMKQALRNFDLNMFLENIKDYLLSIDWASYVEQLADKIPSSNLANVMESMNDVIINWIDEYEIPNKLNAIYSYLKDLVLKYNIDDILKGLMDRALILLNEFKIEETVQSITATLKTINFEWVYDKIMLFLDTVTEQLRGTEFKKTIDDLNENISSMLKALKEFDYHQFIDEANSKIAELTEYLNDQIKKYEIVQKIEAVRDFFRETQNSIHTYLDELKDTKVAEALKKLKNVIDTTIYNDVKIKVQDILEDMRQRISDMDIRDEMYIYLQRVSDSYSNIVSFISVQFDQLMDKIRNMFHDNNFIDKVKQTIGGVLDRLKSAEIVIPSFTLPLTDLVIPGFTINLNRLQDIKIPAKISLPEFTILNTFTIPAFMIDFEELKAKIIAVIDNIREFELQTPDPEDIFGDLKVLYLFDLPDLTFPELTLSEIKIPAINIPKLNLNEFQIEMLPIPEIKLPGIPSDICFPLFGKLHGEFNINLPQYTLVTTGKIENSTSTMENPQFTATFTSQAKSSIEPLEYILEANAMLEAPRMNKLLFTETVKAAHTAFSLDHEGSLTLTGPSAEASATTTAKATTDWFTADLINNMALTLTDGISATMDTTYNHNLALPSLETMCEASMKQNLAATIEPGKITVNAETNGDGKWSIKDYSDEGTHKSKLGFDIDSSIAKLTFVDEIDSKVLKTKKMLNAEAVSLSHITVEARCESELPFVKKSIMVLNGEAHVGDLKLALTASHNAEFMENVMGGMSNSLDFIAHPFEIVLDAKNKLNSKISFPMKLTGKVDFQHDYGITLNSEKQAAFCLALARFNHYKYSHNIQLENNDMDISLHALANGEANLEFLTVPLSIPEIPIPHLEITTPEIRDFSLWEHAGFKDWLTTPQQSFDLNLKLQYFKNPDTHSFELHLEPIYNAFSDNVNTMRIHFEECRDKVVALLKDSYNHAKSQYIKHKINTSSMPPRIFRVPGYKIPILNIEVSAFRAEMPAFNYFVPKEVSTASFKIPALGFSVPSYTLVLPSLKFPVIHVPETLSEITLPTFTLPAIQNNIVIPAMGNITLDFSFKSPVITLSANGGLFNQSADIVARFGGLSTSVFDILKGKIDSTTSLTRKRGLKLATTVSLEHNNVEANHECAISLNKRNMEASVVNAAKINLPFLNLEFNEELKGNTKNKPNMSSKKKVKYMFNIPLIDSTGKGNLDLDWELEALSSYLSLETATKGKSDISIMDSYNYAGDLEHLASFYLNANGLRSTIRTALNSNFDKQEKQKRSSNDNIFLFKLNNNLALEISLRRVYATIDYVSNNNLELGSLDTSGKHSVSGELDFAPLKMLKTRFNIDASQSSSSLGDAGLLQNVDLDISSEKQSFIWTGKEQLASFIHACDLLMSNDESEARMDLTGSVEGHLAFLKSVRLPIYQKNIWDVLKFDQVTNMNELQFFNISSSVVYTKSMDGLEFALPFQLFENGVKFSIPEVNIPIPSWVKSVPDSLRSIDMRLESLDVPDHLTLPPTISVPAFDVPFTNLHVEPFTIDPKSLDIPKVITTKAFEIMLPGLPTMSVPSYDINTEYLQGKMSFLALRIPQYEITVSAFPIPKSFTIGEQTFSLNDITNEISNFELPTIVIPEQKIEIPEMSLNLPSSVFIPSFGALSATLKVSSPIYAVSTTAKVEKKDSNLEASVDSLCTSTMIFLEYDLKGAVTVGYDNGVINLNGKCNFLHKDVTADWQHVLTQNLRMKRQTSSADSMESRHTLNVDILSPTFVDVNFRFASHKDGNTASVSSPSAGFLGWQFMRRSPSQLFGKLFSRHLSSPGKDIDVITAKVTLKNSERLTFQTSWNWEFFHDVIEGIKFRIPAMREAVDKFVNKYHVYHFGFDLNRGSMKLKNTLSNSIERIYHEVPVSFNAVQDMVQNLGDQGKDLYRRASDSLRSMTVQDAVDSLVEKLRQARRSSEEKISGFLDAFQQFLSDTKLKVPGQEQETSLLELWEDIRRFISKAFERAVHRFHSLVEKIKESEFTIPGTDVVVNGMEVLDRLGTSLVDALRQTDKFLARLANFITKTVDDLFQTVAAKAEEFLNYLKDQNWEVSNDIDAAHARFLQSLKQQTDEGRRLAAESKDVLKLKIQEVYDGLTMERVNVAIWDFVTYLQSNVYEAVGKLGDLMRGLSQSTAPYFRVSNKKIDVEIPLPFNWKSFNEWPTQYRQL